MGEEINALKCGDENQNHMVMKEVRPDTRHGRRSVIGVGNFGHLESRLTKLERTVEQILELVIQQNQRQGKETVLCVLVDILKLHTFWFDLQNDDEIKCHFLQLETF